MQPVTESTQAKVEVEVLMRQIKHDKIWLAVVAVAVFNLPKLD